MDRDPGDQGEVVTEHQLRVTVDPGSGASGAWPVVRASGEVDIQTSPLLAEQLQAVLDQGHSSVLVHFGDVTFLDSTGLSVLVAGLKRCHSAGGELRLVSPRPNVRRVLEITGLTETLHVDPE
jgi:anti-sigma B factor antagonist